MLERPGYVSIYIKTYDFQTGAAALEILRQGQIEFNMALVDLQTPGLTESIHQLPLFQNLPVGLLISPKQRQAVKPESTQQVAGLVQKPLKIGQLYDLLNSILVPISPENAAGSHQILPDTPPAAYPLIILLAEDNVVNQKLALRMLEYLGHRADLASNGLEVLAALENKNYELILMDIQMPQMDDLTASRTIRHAGRKIMAPGSLP